jgi:hypothetical protein
LSETVGFKRERSQQVNESKSRKQVVRYVEEDESFWRNHLLCLERSGLTRANYCKEKGVNYDRFGYWKKVLRRNSEVVDANPKSLLNAKPKLLPITIKSDKLKSHELLGLCRLELRNGNCLHLHDRALVEQLLSWLV